MFGIVGAVSAKTIQTWQVYSPLDNILVIHENASPYSPVCFVGNPIEQDGTFCEGVDASIEYKVEQRRLSQLR